jgi:hypothetical protein
MTYGYTNQTDGNTSLHTNNRIVACLLFFNFLNGNPAPDQVEDKHFQLIMDSHFRGNDAKRVRFSKTVPWTWTL